MLGHQPEEVIGGALLGALVGVIGHACSNKGRKLSKFRLNSDSRWF